MQQNFSLKQYNTFGIEAQAQYFEELNHINQLEKLNSLPSFLNNRLILGGGSNILLTKDFEGIVVHNNLRGIELVHENNKEVILKVAAGEVWHELVLYTIENAYAGIENLSLIPGRVGAAPMQNIGAYGVELKDVFVELEAWNIEKQQIEIFNLEQCEFGYRESVFKKAAKGKYLIISVSVRLQKEAQVNVSYGAIESTLNEMKIDNPSIRDVSDAVIAIRSLKLPNPAEIGNAGSFFKNPIVPHTEVERLLKTNPQMPFYKIDEGESKIPAGWLIEQAGWKGKKINNYGVHKNQALVLVNYGGAQGNDIKNLAFDIKADVQQKFGIEINPEVNFV